MKKKRGQYPQKTAINLVIKEKSQFRPGRVIPTFTAVVVAAVLFGKFAVADRLQQVDTARAALNQRLAYQQTLEEATANYDAVLDEFSRFSSGWQNETEAAQVDRLDAAELVERELMRAAVVLQYAVTGNTLTADLSGLSLGDSSLLVERLYTYPTVAQVDVYRAATAQGESEEATLSLVVALALPATEGGASE